MANTNTIMGAEAEYAVSAISSTNELSTNEVAQRLYRLASKTLPYLGSHDGDRMFLSNGGCIYLDIGDKVEYGSPECANPWDLVRYVRAGDAIMGKLCADLSEQIGADVTAGRGNVGYGLSPQTWASHESFSSRQCPRTLSEGLTPFLCSRVVYAGSGGFDPFAHGISFSLSPRSAFLSATSSGESTRSRGIVHLKDESLNDSGLHRLHLICGDALGSELALWLRAGTTALVVCLLDHGYAVPPAITPADPLRALRRFAADPTLCCSVGTESGAKVSALDIQWEYLRAIENSQDTKSYPEWAPKVLAGWRRILELLDDGPERVATSLDWAVKFKLYTEFAAQHGVNWDKLAIWNRVIERIEGIFRRTNVKYPECLTPSVLMAAGSPVADHPLITSYMLKNDLDWDQLEDVMALRLKLFELETRYLQVGGIFDQLDSAGVLDHHAIDDRRAMSGAVSRPPEGTRAKVRGDYVRQYAGRRTVTAGWTRIQDSLNSRTISLGNPFATDSSWKNNQTSGADDDDDQQLGGIVAAVRQAIATRRPGDRAAVRQSSALEMRMRALEAYRDGEYDEARGLLVPLVDVEFELCSTYCHLCRIDIIEHDYAQAREHLDRAWEHLLEAPTYMVPRILWLQTALILLHAVDRPLQQSIGKLKTALSEAQPYDWSMQPVTRRLATILSGDDLALLETTAAVISGAVQISALDRNPLWSSASPERME